MKPLSEAAFQAHIVRVAQLNGWMVMHISDSRKQVGEAGRSTLIGDRLARGWPDLVLCHPRRNELLIRELKSQRGRVQPEQRDWIEALAAADVDVGVWRPSDLPEIEATLGFQRQGRAAA